MAGSGVCAFFRGSTFPFPTEGMTCAKAPRRNEHGAREEVNVGQTGWVSGCDRAGEQWGPSYRPRRETESLSSELLMGSAPGNNMPKFAV